MKSWFKILLLLTSFTAAAQQPVEYLLADANDYFKAGRYFEAFYAYRGVARHPDYMNNMEVLSQIKNTSNVMFLKRRYENYAGFQQYDMAKKYLVDAVAINPNDPDRGQIPKLTLKQGETLQRMAWRQLSREATANMLQKAIGYYHQAITEGLKDESIRTLIRMAEVSLEKTGVQPTEPTTTYGIEATTQKIERPREVKVIKEN